MFDVIMVDSETNVRTVLSTWKKLVKAEHEADKENDKYVGTKIIVYAEKAKFVRNDAWLTVHIELLYSNNN